MRNITKRNRNMSISHYKYSINIPLSHISCHIPLSILATNGEYGTIRTKRIIGIGGHMPSYNIRCVVHEYVNKISDNIKSVKTLKWYAYRSYHFGGNKPSQSLRYRSVK